MIKKNILSIILLIMGFVGLVNPIYSKDVPENIYIPAAQYFTNSTNIENLQNKYNEAILSDDIILKMLQQVAGNENKEIKINKDSDGLYLTVKYKDKYTVIRFALKIGELVAQEVLPADFVYSNANKIIQKIFGIDENTVLKKYRKEWVNIINRMYIITMHTLVEDVKDNPKEYGVTNIEIINTDKCKIKTTAPLILRNVKDLEIID